MKTTGLWKPIDEYIAEELNTLNPVERVSLGRTVLFSTPTGEVYSGHIYITQYTSELYWAIVETGDTEWFEQLSSREIHGYSPTHYMELPEAFKG